jgi:uncharacterized phage protein (TIGR02218 family)
VTTFKEADTSVSLGAPVEFYKFSGELGNYFYTNDSVPHTYKGDVYLPENISRTAIEITSVLDSIVTVDVELPVTNKLAQLYCLVNLPTFLNVEIFRWHRETDIEVETKRIWSGQSTGYKISDNWATIETSSRLHANLNLSTNQVTCQAQCNHRLYDSRCKLNPNDFKWNTTALIIKGTKIFVENDQNEDHILKLGKLVVDRTGENRIITDNMSNTITVIYPFIDIVPGEPVSIYMGCDKAYSTCIEKFNNVVNFGGFKWLPIDNPFNGGI